MTQLCTDRCTQLLSLQARLHLSLLSNVRKFDEGALVGGNYGYLKTIDLSSEPVLSMSCQLLSIVQDYSH